MLKDTNIEKSFPELLASGYEICSPVDYKYNCIAFAADDQNKWWWPTYFYWPPNISRTTELSSFIKCFESLGYKVCKSQIYEPSYEKVAIFVDSNNIPTHAAKQSCDSRGFWKSKLGREQDIIHSLEALCGDKYGKVAVVLKRKCENTE